MLTGVAASLALMRLSAAAPVLVFAVCVAWGLCATAFNVAFQSQIIDFTSADAGAVAMSIFSGLFNLGIGCGTAIGGAVVARGAIGGIGYVGAGIAAVGVALAAATLFPAMQRRAAGDEVAGE